MVSAASIWCGRSRGDTKDEKIVPVVTMWCNRTCGDKKDQKWSLLSPCGAADRALTEKTRKWFMVSPSCYGIPRGDKRDQKMVHGITIMLRNTLWWQKRPENGPWCYHCVVKYLAVTQKIRKWFMVSPSCCVKPRSETKHDKIVHGVAIVLRETLRWQKDQKMVPAVTM